MTALIRTSISHPIRVDWVRRDIGDGRGRIGCTLAPGKKASSLFGGSWDRDLAADLDRLRGECGVAMLISLIEDHELDLLHIPSLVEDAEGRGISIVRSPIIDTKTPSLQQAGRLVQMALERARAGDAVVFHCRGGLGRAGTLASCCLIELGATAQVAIAEVRAARPGSVENADQEAFVAKFYGARV